MRWTETREKILPAKLILTVTIDTREYADLTKSVRKLATSKYNIHLQYIKRRFFLVFFLNDQVHCFSLATLDKKFLYQKVKRRL